MSYEWNDDLALGIPMIDEQHKTLLELAGRLPEKTGPELEEAIDVLLKYTFEHFAAEEQYMSGIDYPAYDQHCLIHQSFNSQFDNYFRAYLQHDIDYKSFRQFVIDWVQQHIMGEDQKIAAFVKQR